MSRVNAVSQKLYAGVWVASVRGRVVASGGSAQETLLHCRAMRLKDEPVLRFYPAAKPQSADAERRRAKKSKHDAA